MEFLWITKASETFVACCSLYDLVELDRKPATASLRHRKGAKSAPAMRKYLRRATAAVECTPEHAQMQAKLLAELKREFDGQGREQERYDYLSRKLIQIIRQASAPQPVMQAFREAVWGVSTPM
jgi:hypothetical protein